MGFLPNLEDRTGRGGLRRRLLRFGLGLVGVCAVVFGAFWMVVRFQIVPVLTEHVRSEAHVNVQDLVDDLAVPLAAGDGAGARSRLKELLEVDDFAFAIVRDANDHVVASVGSAPIDPPFGGRATVPHRNHDGWVAWAPIVLEGLPMGSVAVGFATTRVDLVLNWLALFALAGGALVAVASVFAVRYSAAFVAPLRDVIGLSQRLARGELGSRLLGSAPGELGELVVALNGMADSLETRDRVIEEKRVELAASLEALGKLQRRLVEASRLAGMAEVATGVLHNVGNILNSVNVSGQVIEDTLRASSSALLPRAAGLLTEHHDHLADFLANDPRGQKLPAFLVALSGTVESEQQKMLDETVSMRRNIEHIKTIVASQQTFARSGGHQEVLSVVEVVETALGIEEVRMQHSDIALVRELAPMPEINVDRNKLLQVLVNLLSNARHALCEVEGVCDRVLTVHAEALDAGRIAIRIRDNGVGIPAANLTRIFEHGFTTKKDGHGFGLHSSANAAREMGGRLQVESDGPGRGATFTLEIPIAMAEAA